MGGFQRGKHSAALFHNPSQDVRMAVHGDDFVCFSNDGGINHIVKLHKSKYKAGDMGTLGFEASDKECLLLWHCVFRVLTDQIGHYSDVEPDLTHAPLIFNKSGCNTDTTPLQGVPGIAQLLKRADVGRAHRRCRTDNCQHFS